MTETIDPRLSGIERTRGNMIMGFERCIDEACSDCPYDCQEPQDAACFFANRIAELTE